jgi:protein O-mannosyl-transferase
MKMKEIGMSASEQVSRSQAQSNLQNTTVSQGLPWWYYLIPPSLLTILTWLLYYPSLNYPFQFDDIANISKKYAIRFDDPLMRCWNNPRWLGDWLNTWNYQFGLFDPFYYRFFNVFIHLCAGLVLFWLVFELCRSLKDKLFFYDNALLLAFATAGLFLLHPVQTQTVSYVVQARLEGLASFFVLSTLLAFVKAVHAPLSKARYAWFAAFYLLALLSCGTKEIVIVIPFLLLLIDWFFLSQGQWSEFKTRLVTHAIFAVIFFAVMIHYIGSHFVSDVVTLKATTGNNRGNILTENAFDIISPFRFLISEFRVLLHYITMFVWPFGISVEYDWKVASGFFTHEVILPLFALLIILGFVVANVFHKTFQYFSFGMLWFFIAIAPRATIIPSPELVCDYKSYLASSGIFFLLAIPLVGFFLWVMSNLKNIPEFFASKYTQTVMLAVLIIPVGAAAFARNKVWETCVAFWQDNVKKAPNKARPHNNLGVALCEAGRIDEALKEYQTAIDMDSNYSDPLSNIAVAYSLKGDIDRAIESLKSAIHICPNYPEAYNNLGTLLLQKKCYDDAERTLKFAIMLRPYYGKAYYNLARMAEERNQHEEAWAYLKKATEGDLDVPEVFFKLGQMSLRVKKYKEAVQAFEKILDRGCSDQQVWFNLANAFYMDGALDRAQAIYQRLTRDYPLDGRYAYNLAETLFTKNEFDKAIELFKKVTTLPQPIPQAFFRTANCLEKMNKVEEAKNYLQDLMKANAPDDFKKMIKGELVRLDLHPMVNSNDNSVSIKLKDFQQALAKNGVTTKTTMVKKA